MVTYIVDKESAALEHSVYGDIDPWALGGTLISSTGRLTNQKTTFVCWREIQTV